VHAWSALAWCDERVALGKAGDALALPFPVRDDGIETRAPLAGVVAALRAARHELCVVLPVDMPLVDEGALRQLAGACGGASDAAIPPTGPLPGAYRRSALRGLEPALAAGRLGLWRALAALAVVEVPLPSHLLANVNTVEDLPV
jgi:molybdopterin-guanine dinucleotide biosynthesis protein A